MKSTATFVIAVVSGVIADIVSKWIVFSKLYEFGKLIAIPGLLNILRSKNEGVVFGLFPGKTSAFIVFSAIAIVVILLIYIKSDKTIFISNLALGLVLAGAIGNLWDRIWFRGVRDFIDLHIGDKYHWPTFNVADSLICVGISILVFTSFSAPKPKETA
ncbi:MAG TPA: signal peptidase II [Candidatus Wunengus sp. YC61]|uniref:signal peptidase II n=1 Tax=Candidatus Wunengus sp. YC61 TaxID=3367698 RepID=UPI0040291087